MPDSWPGSVERLLTTCMPSHLISHLSRLPRPSGADGRSEAISVTRLCSYLLNGLELVELPAGCASGMHGTHADGSGMCISAPRHGSTRVSFTVKRR